MATRIHGALKRELVVNRTSYTLTLTLDGFKLVEKGRRKGLEIAWKDLVSGDVALATALQASIIEK